MDKIIARRSIGGWLIFASIALFCIILGVTRLNRHSNSGYLLLCGGFIVFVSALVQLLIVTPRVIIDAEGISALVLGKRKFLWKEIRSADLQYIPRGYPVITLLLHDKTQHSFALGGVNVSAEQIFSEITANIREYGSRVNKQPEPENEDGDTEI